VRVSIDIVALGQGGEGVGSFEGRTIFVPFTAPGDRVLVELPSGKGPGRADLLEIVAPASGRVAAPCRHFGPGEGAGCGGCEWQHLAYEDQVAAKERAFAQTLRRIGALAEGSYASAPAVRSPSPLRYRVRAKFHFDRKEGRLVFFRRRSHERVQVRECHLLEPELDSLRESTGAALSRVGLDVREATLEWSRHQGRGAAHLRVASPGPASRKRAEALLAALPALTGVVLGTEGAPPILVGDPVLKHERVPGRPEAGLQRSRPDVFQQANRAANALLVEKALELLEPAGEDVLELFCGAGNFTAPISACARSVCAIEAQGPSLDLARADMAELSRERSARVRFFAGDWLALARAFGRETGRGRGRFRVALLDPPREGARGVGPALRDLGVGRAVYVSCDPATLARDLKTCREAGYRVAAVQAIDLFPQTHHLEAVALMVCDQQLGR